MKKLLISLLVIIVGLLLANYFDVSIFNNNYFQSDRLGMVVEDNVTWTQVGPTPEVSPNRMLIHVVDEQNSAISNINIYSTSNDIVTHRGVTNEQWNLYITTFIPIQEGDTISALNNPGYKEKSLTVSNEILNGIVLMQLATDKNSTYISNPKITLIEDGVENDWLITFSPRVQLKITATNNTKFAFQKDPMDDSPNAKFIEGTPDSDIVNYDLKVGNNIISVQYTNETEFVSYAKYIYYVPEGQKDDLTYGITIIPNDDKELSQVYVGHDYQYNTSIRDTKKTIIVPKWENRIIIMQGGKIIYEKTLIEETIINLNSL